MLPAVTVLFITAIGLLMLIVLVMLSTGSFLSVFVVLALAGIIIYVLVKLGYFSVDITDSGEIDISFHEKAPLPAKPIGKAESVLPAVDIQKKEVFYVSGNDYTYEEAAAVCAAYDSDLATYDQVNESYSAGAEWCGYGWTQGGMALFPTQQSTWNDLQQEMSEEKRTSCGRPGVNGGYFDPNTKFGVNCYGVKPKNTHFKFPVPLPGTDTKQFDGMVSKFKSMLNRMVVSPFNRDGWSAWNVSAHV